MGRIEKVNGIHIYQQQKVNSGITIHKEKKAPTKIGSTDISLSHEPTYWGEGGSPLIVNLNRIYTFENTQHRLTKPLSMRLQTPIW